MAMFAAATISVTSHAVATGDYWEFKYLNPNKTPGLLDTERAARIDLIYYAFSKEPIPYEDIAPQISRPYAHEGDVFKRHQMMDGIKVQIDNLVAFYRSHPNFFLESPCHVGQYDFKTSSFPTGKLFYFTYSSQFDYLNENDFEGIKISNVDRAKALNTRLLNFNKLPICRLYVSVLRTGDKENKVLQLNITKEELYDPQGEELLAVEMPTHEVASPPKLGPGCQLYTCFPSLRRWLALGPDYHPKADDIQRVVCAGQSFPDICPGP